MPISIALNLTMPERVTRFNLEDVKARVLRGADHPNGARYIERRDGQRFDLSVCNVDDAALRLVAGDLVERPLKDGDLVVMNRQPSLHKVGNPYAPVRHESH